MTSGIDWFELHGDVTYDDQQVSLPALLAALIFSFIASVWFLAFRASGLGILAAAAAATG